MAGIKGWARGNVTFNKCSTVGATINVPATYKGFGNQSNTPFDNRTDATVGMILGYSSADATFIDCTTNGTVNFAAKVGVRPKAKTGTETETTPTWIGGMAGYVGGKATFTNSTNTATVNTSNTTANAVGVLSAGGFIGNAGGGLSMNGCTNNGAMVAQSSFAYLGGFVGQLKNNATNEFTNCTNGRNGTVSRAMPSANSGMAGFIGFAMGEKNPSLKIKFEGCVNQADITNIAISGDNPNGGAMLGGFVGEARCAANIEFKNCINNGDVKTATGDAVHNYQGSGGFIGCQRVAGFNWTTTVKTITTKFTNCLNNGDITSVHSAGGLVGRSIEMQKPDDTYGPYTITAENCANTGKISAPQAGGMYGAANDDSGYVCVVDVTFNKCVNAGDIDNGGKPDTAFLGGLVGDAKHGTITVTNSVSVADIAKGDAVAGIIGNIGDTITVSITNSNVLGSIDNTSKLVNPICNGKSTYKNNLFDENMIDDWFDEADYADERDVEAAIDKLGVMAVYGRDRLADLIAEVEALKDNSDDYDADKWSAVQTKLANAKSTVNKETMTISSANVSILDQSVLNKAYYELYDARMALGDKVDNSSIDDVIKQAEKLDSKEYTSESWAMLQSALASAKMAKASGDDAIIAEAEALLKDAIEDLVKIDKTPDVEQDKEDNTTKPEPEATQKPDTTDDTDKPTDGAATEPTEEAEESSGGCGGVIGVSAVAVVAVMALGMGVSFKKKD